MSEVTLKKYFYVLRGLFAIDFIIDNHIISPIEFKILLNEVDVDPDIKSIIQENLKKKETQTEKIVQKPILELNNFIEARLQSFDEKIRKIKIMNKIDWGILDSLFLKTVSSKKW